MSFKLGKKVLIVNDAAQAQLLFFAKLASGVRNLVETDDAFGTAFANLATSPDGAQTGEGAGYLPHSAVSAIAIAQADLLRITGFADLIGSEIIDVVGAKGVAGAKQVSTATFTALTATAGLEVVVNINFKSADLRGEFASHLSDYKRKKSFVLVVKSTDTVTTLGQRLTAQINSIVESGWQSWVTATDGAAGVVNLTSSDNDITFTVDFIGTTVPVTGAFATSVAGYEGRNTYEQLKDLRLETVVQPYAESFKTNQLPIKGAKYSSYLIRKRVTRDDLAGLSGGLNQVPTGDFLFEIYVNESTASGFLNNLIWWLNANVVTRTMYTATTAAGAIAAEAPAPSVAVAASPFTVGLT